MSSFKGRVKYAALFVLCGWMFFMGVLVGRGTAPVEFDTGWFQKRLAIIFEASQEEELLVEKPELDFYEALTTDDRDEEFHVKGDYSPSGNISENSPVNAGDSSEKVPLKRSRKAMTIAIQAKATHSVQAKLTGEVQGEQVESEHVLPPVKPENPVEKVALTLLEKTEKPSESPRNYDYIYTIQIASYLNEKDARDHIAQLGAKGYRAYKNIAKVNDKIWFRVRSGSFDTLSEARARLQELEKKGVKGLIIQKK